MSTQDIIMLVIVIILSILLLAGMFAVWYAKTDTIETDEEENIKDIKAFKRNAASKEYGRQR